MEFVYNKYYIIDNFGNYYRLDDQGKLVAAHSKKEATLFSYEELEAKLGKRKRSRFYKSLPADDAVLEGYMVSGKVVTGIEDENAIADGATGTEAASGPASDTSELAPTVPECTNA